MTITLIPGVVEKGLLPVVCICQGCRRKMTVTEIGDFRVANLSSGMDNLTSMEAYCKCPACGDYAFPSEKKEELMKAYRDFKDSKKKKR